MSTSEAENVQSFGLLRARHDYREYLAWGGRADWATWWDHYRGDYE